MVKQCKLNCRHRLWYLLRCLDDISWSIWSINPIIGTSLKDTLCQMPNPHFIMAMGEKKQPNLTVIQQFVYHPHITLRPFQPLPANRVALYSGVTPQVSPQTFVARIYPYGKTKNSWPPGLQEGWGGADGVGYISSTPRNVHSPPLLNKAQSCSTVTSWGIPTQDYFHKPRRHRDKNNLMSDTNVEICQQTTNMLSNESAICSWLDCRYSQVMKGLQSNRENFDALIFKARGRGLRLSLAEPPNLYALVLFF